MAVHHFCHFLEGQQFHILTDRKPLTFASAATNSAHTPWEIHQPVYTSEFASDVRHICGKDNLIADELSRIEVKATVDEHPTVDFAAMATAQREDRVSINQLKPAFLDADSIPTDKPPSKTKRVCFAPGACHLHEVKDCSIASGSLARREALWRSVKEELASRQAAQGLTQSARASSSCG